MTHGQGEFPMLSIHQDTMELDFKCVICCFKQTIQLIVNYIQWDKYIPFEHCSI